jgi:three-Cys-motif partner protein
MSKKDLSQSGLYLGREQSLVKHLILQSYLERFAHIIGFRWDAIAYVDCFSGPWKERSQDLKDTSFCIALEELRKARQTHQTLGKSLELRCFFLEKDPKAYAKLKEFANSITDAEIAHKNAALEDSIDDILKFIRKVKSFPFIFIDPTGWTGFGMDVISPLLRLAPGEVLINFMTGHISRFIESPDVMTQESFINLFGSASFKDRLKGLTGLDREDAVVGEYCKNVAKTGRFSFTAKAIVLHPETDRTHFHLIYATRHHKGIEVFKKAEQAAMAEMEHARAEARQRIRQGRTLQRDLFSEPEIRHSTNYFGELRDRYLAKAKSSVIYTLEHGKQVLYDDVWAQVLSEPLVWESDLNDWIEDWEKTGKLVVQGKRSPRQKILHRDQNNFLVWRG